MESVKIGVSYDVYESSLSRIFSCGGVFVGKRDFNLFFIIDSFSDLYFRACDRKVSLPGDKCLYYGANAWKLNGRRSLF